MNLVIAAFKIENSKFLRLTTNLQAVGITENAAKNMELLTKSILDKLRENDMDHSQLQNVEADVKYMKVWYADKVLQAVADLTGISLVLFTSIKQLPVLTMFAKNSFSTKHWLFLGVEFAKQILFYKLNKNCTPTSAEPNVPEKQGKRIRQGCCCGSNSGRAETPKCLPQANDKYKCRG